MLINLFKYHFKKMNNLFPLFFIGIILLLFIISHSHFIDDTNNINNDNYDINIDKQFLLKFNQKLQSLNFDYNNDDNSLFPLVTTTATTNKNARRLFNRDIYDGKTGQLILSSKGELRLYPNAEEIPPSCGFGKLYFNKNDIDDRKSWWTCVCSAPDYFGGIYCDEPQRKLIIENKCMKVGHIDDLENTDISTFNPFLKGVCVECSTKDATPDLSSPIPKCQIINKIEEDDKNIKKKNNGCFSDPINPNLNSTLNKYVKGYGCVCDYYNGFVEINVGGYNNDKENGEDIQSNACLKIGNRSRHIKDYYHKTHLAYYTLKNSLKPIQVHEYNQLELPYQSLFGKNKKLLVNQPAKNIVHKYDWLNRHVKANPKQKIRRLNYPNSDWPVVHKQNLINSYERRNETYPISAYNIANGRGFELKHWYESTNLRYLNNSVWGHPIMYGSYNKDDKNNIWYNHCTLNPLGPIHLQYYGLTMLYKPGSIIRLDTRGFESEKKYNNVDTFNKIHTIPPDYKNEMMNSKDIFYLPYLYNTYIVKN